MINQGFYFIYSAILLVLIGCGSKDETTSEVKSDKSVEKSDRDSLPEHKDSVKSDPNSDTIYYPYYDDDFFGYRDTSWNRVTKPVYTLAGEFSEGIACVLAADGFWYLINKKFETVFKFSHFVPIDIPNEMAGIREVMNSTEGLLPVKYKEGKFGFMNMKNRSAFGEFDEVLNFSNGLAAVRVNDKWGFIDHSGKWVHPAKFDHVFSFSDNRAYVCEGEHCFFIDKKGNRFFDHKYLRQAFRFKEGLTFVTYSQDYDQYFLVDTTGRVVNKGPYDAVYNLGFEKGECEVIKNGKCIVIDRKGNKIRDKKDGCVEGC